MSQTKTTLPTFKAKGTPQFNYQQLIEKRNQVICVGPAGTGKTYQKYKAEMNLK